MMACTRNNEHHQGFDSNQREYTLLSMLRISRTVRFLMMNLLSTNQQLMIRCSNLFRNRDDDDIMVVVVVVVDERVCVC